MSKSLREQLDDELNGADEKDTERDSYSEDALDQFAENDRQPPIRRRRVSSTGSKTNSSPSQPKPNRRVRKEVRVVVKRVVNWKAVLGAALLFAVIIVILMARFAPQLTSFAHLAWKSTSSYNRVVLGQVQKIAVLPDEIPTIIEILDPSEFSDVASVNEIQVGDVALVFERSRQMAIYRPGNGKMVAMLMIKGAEPQEEPEESMDEGQEGAGLDIEENDAIENTEINRPETPSFDPSEPITIEIRNGTGRSGLASVTKTEIEALNLGVQVLATANAARQRAGSLLVPVSGREIPSSILESLENEFSVTVGEDLPNGESDSDADLVLILGR